MIATVSRLTEALEVASDVAVEFQSFMLGLELIPLHLDNGHVRKGSQISFGTAA